MNRPPRKAMWGGYPDSMRIDLLTNDIDELERAMEELRRTLNWILGLLFMVLISTTTGTVMLLITGVVK